jgi:hypothetical protein
VISFNWMAYVAVCCRTLGIPVSDYTYDDCRLMTKAKRMNLPFASGLVEVQKLRQKLGWVSFLTISSPLIAICTTCFHIQNYFTTLTIYVLYVWFSQKQWVFPCLLLNDRSYIQTEILNIFCKYLRRSRDSTISIATVYRLDDQRVGIWVPV